MDSLVAMVGADISKVNYNNTTRKAVGLTFYDKRSYDTTVRGYLATQTWRAGPGSRLIEIVSVSCKEGGEYGWRREGIWTLSTYSLDIPGEGCPLHKSATKTH